MRCCSKSWHRDDAQPWTIEWYLQWKNCKAKWLFIVVSIILFGYKNGEAQPGAITRCCLFLRASSFCFPCSAPLHLQVFALAICPWCTLAISIARNASAYNHHHTYAADVMWDEIKRDVFQMERLTASKRHNTERPHKFNRNVYNCMTQKSLIVSPFAFSSPTAIWSCVVHHDDQRNNA